LGAWVKAGNPQRVLDVGTGTGLVALMLAQRFEGASIDAVEIDGLAANQAAENVSASKWAKRIVVYHSSFQQFVKKCNGTYDLIVSNPPFFSMGMPSGNTARAIARHGLQLSLQELVSGAFSLLTPSGSMCLILPITYRRSIISMASKCNLWVQSELKIKPIPTLPVNRFIMVLSRVFPEEKRTEELIVEANGRHGYSEKFKKLTKSFYLFEV
jgi:tRNA1Val (adenine37-N6)-methyltransferase